MNRELPAEFDKDVLNNLEDKIYEAAAYEVIYNASEYGLADKTAEFVGIEDELYEMFMSNELEDYDSDLYYDISDRVAEKYSDYKAETGVDIKFHFHIDQDTKKVQLLARVTVDPGYEEISEEKRITLDFENIMQTAPRAIEELSDWMIGK